MQGARTLDVVASAKSFASLLLPQHIEQALREAGFRRPSPVQEAALPLARLGTDLIVQAKAGTGKTLVFAVAAVERVDLSNAAPQVRDWRAGVARACMRLKCPASSVNFNLSFPGCRELQSVPAAGTRASMWAPAAPAAQGLPQRCCAHSPAWRRALVVPPPLSQVLVLAPTREIALQASEAVALVAAALPPPGLACGSFIGGLPVEEDEKQLRR